MVVVNPGWGDAVQANKAGLLEIADLFVINKADRPGGRETRRDLEQMLDLSGMGDATADGDRWRPPILEAVATTGDGVEEVWSAVGDHRSWLSVDGRLTARRAERLRRELGLVVAERLRRRAESLLGEGGTEALEAEVAAQRLDPWEAADRLLPPLDT